MDKTVIFSKRLQVTLLDDRTLIFNDWDSNLNMEVKVSRSQFEILRDQFKQWADKQEEDDLNY